MGRLSCSILFFLFSFNTFAEPRCSVSLSREFHHTSDLQAARAALARIGYDVEIPRALSYDANGDDFRSGNAQVSIVRDAVGAVVFREGGIAFKGKDAEDAREILASTPRLRIVQAELYDSRAGRGGVGEPPAISTIHPVLAEIGKCGSPQHVFEGARIECTLSARSVGPAIAYLVHSAHRQPYGFPPGHDADFRAGTPRALAQYLAQLPACR